MRNNLICLLIAIAVASPHYVSCSPHWHRHFGGYSGGRGWGQHGYTEHQSLGGSGANNDVIVVIVEEEPVRTTYQKPKVQPQVTHQIQQPTVYHFTLTPEVYTIETHQTLQPHPQQIPQHRPTFAQHQPSQDYLPPTQQPIYNQQKPQFVPQTPSNDYLPPVQQPSKDYLPPVRPTQQPQRPSQDYLPPVVPTPSQNVLPPSKDYLPPTPDPHSTRPSRGSGAAKVHEDVLIDEIFSGGHKTQQDDCPTCTSIDVRGFY